jgi:hypothetical protein
MTTMILRPAVDVDDNVVEDVDGNIPSWLTAAGNVGKDVVITSSGGNQTVGGDQTTGRKWRTDAADGRRLHLDQTLCITLQPSRPSIRSESTLHTISISARILSTA